MTTMISPPTNRNQLEETIVDEASTARTVQELEAEIEILKGLEEQAKQVVHSGQRPQMGRALADSAKCSGDA
jgi:hypothetical protein